MSKKIEREDFLIVKKFLADKLERTGILTSKDFDLVSQCLEEQNSKSEEFFICDNCGLKHEIEYTQYPTIMSIECSCGNNRLVQIDKGRIIFKMPIMK